MAEDESKAELTEVPASEILDKIQKGEPVKYDHVRVVGDLDLSKLDLPIEHVDRTELQKQRDLKEDVKIVNSFIHIADSTIQGALDFSNSTFSNFAMFRGVTFSSNAWFYGAIFNNEANFEGATFNKSARFSNATFSRDAVFHCATFDGAGFDGVTFSMDAFFGGTTFSVAFFNGATFGSEARFQGATLRNAWFRGATFKNAWFYKTTFDRRTIFEGAVFGGSAIFRGATFEHVIFNEAKFEGDVLTFRDATFNRAKDQEDACRKAKNVLEKNGDREEAGYHFYREMEAKRIQKGIRGNSGLDLIDCLKTDTWSFWRFFWYDAIEWLFVQMMFGYGVHFERLIVTWVVVVVLFAGLYYHSDAISGVSNAFDSLKISFATAIAPGYIAVIINPGTSTGGIR